MKSKYITLAAVLITVLAVSLLVVYVFKDSWFQEVNNISDVIMDASPVNGGKVSPERGVYYDTYQKNTNLTVTAYPEEGYTFQQWEISTVSAVLERPSQNPYTLTLTEDEYIIMAYFIETG